MARRTAYHVNQKRNQSQGNGQLLMIVIAFATGYMSSTVFDINHLGQWFNQSMEKWTPRMHKNVASLPTKSQLAHQPKLEFYTVLAKQSDQKVPVGTDLQKMIKPPVETAHPVENLALKSDVSDLGSQTSHVKVSLETQKPVITAESHQNFSKKGQYVVQLASFRYYRQAEKFRAKLLLKGFDVKIATVNRGSLQWYRVMLGPFGNQGEAQKAQVSFQVREHMSGMVRPVDV